MKKYVLLFIVMLCLIGCSQTSNKSIGQTSPTSQSVSNKVVEPQVNTGEWYVEYYMDEFGEVTDKSYIVLVGNGVFSNSATTDSEMSAILLVDKSSISLQLIEYKWSVVKENYPFNLKIKDANGNITKFRLRNTPSGYIKFTNNNYTNMLNILKNEGTIRCSGEIQRMSRSNPYTFSFNLDGFNEALSLVK